MQVAAKDGDSDPVTFSVNFDPQGAQAQSTMHELMRVLRTVGRDNTDWREVRFAGVNGQGPELARRGFDDFQTPVTTVPEEEVIQDPLELLDDIEKRHSSFGRPEVVFFPGTNQVRASRLLRFDDEKRGIYDEDEWEEQDGIIRNEARELNERGVVLIAGNTSKFAGGVAQMNAEAERAVDDFNFEEEKKEQTVRH